MRNLFRAEWMKIAGNRWVTGCLVWIFPLFAILATVVLLLIMALSSTFRANFASENLLWTEQAIGVWNFPNNPLGRLVLLGFTAVVFAGEYQWQTWKNVVPRTRRPWLVLVKFVALGLFVVLAFVTMSILWAGGNGLLAAASGASYGPKVSGPVLRDFAGDYGLAMALAFISTVIAAGYAALAGMFTRSILGGVLAGFAMTFIENLSIVGLLLVGYFLNIPRLVHAYRFTPGYNLLNVASWINEHKPTGLDLEVGTTKVLVSDSLGFSLAVLAVWVFGLIALTMYLFHRQDITG